MVHGGNVPTRRAPLAAGVESAALAAYSIAGGIADAFATSGGDHAPWGGLLYTASGLALLALVGMAVRGRTLRSA